MGLRIIIITFKGTIPDLLQSPHCVTNCLQHIHSSGQAQLCANQVQDIGRSCATCGVQGGRNLERDSSCVIVDPQRTV